jgi:hypothetical protein
MTMTDPPNDVVPNPPFLGLYLEEDMGLKNLLTGVMVSDLNAPNETRPVPVWFYNPEREERRITYPNITIRFDSERVAHEREHRGWVEIGYHYLQSVPFDIPPGQALPSIEWPIPMDFDYTVTASARINQHISQISGHLAMSKLHPRFAQMECPGGTVRRITVLGVSRTNSLESDKRLFRQIYQLRISTEIEDVVNLLNTRVRQVALKIMDMDYPQHQLWGPRTISAVPTPSYLDSEIPGRYTSVEET